MWWLYVILIIVGYFIFKSLSSSDSGPSRQRSNYRTRRTGRDANYSKDDKNYSFVQSAKRQESLGNFDEASRLYLKAGHVFSAAKMKAMKGPQEASNAVELIRINAPERIELVTRNLANEFFYRLDQPATAAALLRNLGLDNEAEAVEVAAGISPTKTVVEQVTTSSEAKSVTQSADVSISAQSDVDLDQTISSDEIPDTPSAETKESIEEEVTQPREYPNTLMMASTKLDKQCSVCRRAIKSGDSFIFCLHCGHPGHYAHLGEMIKVTGKCPSCKNRLVPTMYDIQ